MTSTHLDLDGALARFGLSSFRPGQREVISAIVSGHDCMCVMPTGGGKSLCYQLPAIIRPGLTIVVSPLIALMKDQVDSLGQKGIPAALINSTLSLSEQTQRLQDVSVGKYQLVYVAPERLRSKRFLDAIRATPIQLLAIDEAHCISQWGHDFRPDYARLGKFREWLGDVQTVALTATATPRVRSDIVEVLRLHKPKQFMSGFARPNLDLGVVARQSDREKDEQLESFLKREPGSGIIYAATRKRCESLVEMIQQKLRVPVGAYHAGLVPEQRRAIQERFMKNELRIIVATNAFGMGIDKPDLRFVVHYNMPGSLEAYYQEAGRAGRDGQQSQCVLLYSTQDRYIQEFFIDNNYPAREIIESVYEFLCERQEDPIELTHEEIRDALGLSVSGESIGSCLQILARTDVIERLETAGGLAMIRLDSDLPTLVDLLPRDATVKRKVMRVVERIVGQRRSEEVYVHPRWLMQELEMDRDVMNRHLRELADRLKQFDYVPPFRGRAIHFLRRGVAFSELGIDFAALAKRKEAEYERLNQVVRYAQTLRCRQSAILNYFGDTDVTDCGHCDRCLGAHGWPQLAQRMQSGAGKQADATNKAPAVTTEVGWVQKYDHELDPSAGKSAGPSQQSTSNTGVTQAAAATDGAAATELVPSELQSLLKEVLAAIDRTHGRLGKNLIAQFLCGSNNAKVQKLRLHRMAGFGLLEALRIGDAVAVIDVFLQFGLLQQQEVNKHRPTVTVSEDIQRGTVDRRAILERIRLPKNLIQRLLAIARSPAVEGQAGSKPTTPTAPAVSNSAAATVEGKSALPTQFATTPSKTTPASPTPASPTPTLLAPVNTTPTTDAAVVEDWVWTWQLFVDGYSWNEVLSIRRKDDLEVATDLQQALRRNKTVQRAWLLPEASRSDAPRDGSASTSAITAEPALATTGQQRLLRELQRRSAAGV